MLGKVKVKGDKACIAAVRQCFQVVHVITNRTDTTNRNVTVPKTTIPQRNILGIEKIITQCPYCLAKFKLGSEKIRKKIRCPKCKEPFEVFELYK